jgi:hypothetical protein
MLGLHEFFTSAIYPTRQFTNTKREVVAMDKKILLPTLLIASMLIGITAVSAAKSDALAINKINENNIEQIKYMIPATYEDTDAKIAPIRNRYIMWTTDGAHIMWGFYARGFFTGTDDLGKYAWGIYGKNVFAGFYDGEFFWGKYYGNNWKATGLFGQEISQGKYVTFPSPILATAEATPTAQ